MNNLSDRLNLIADNIEKGETMADIGTDHGFLPLHLVKSGKSPYAILADISRGSLDKGIDNINAYCEFSGEDIRNKFDCRLGDGISVLEVGEVDVVCIAGMGGILISEILEANMNKTISFKKFILQPRNATSKLRYWLINNGFEIEKNLLVREGKFICEIIVAVPEKHKKGLAKGSPTDEEYEFPKDIYIYNMELAVELAQRKIKWDKDILESIGEQDPERKNKIKNHMKYFENILEEWSNIC